MTRSSSRTLVICVALVALIGALWVAGPWLNRLVFPADYQRFGAVTVGMPRAQVLELLGAPSAECGSGDTIACRVDGYAFKARAVGGRLLFYHGVEHVAYIYLSEEDRVEEVFLAGS